MNLVCVTGSAVFDQPLQLELQVCHDVGVEQVA